MYRAEREIYRGKWVGTLFTIGIHVLLFSLLVFKGVKTVYPPPAEKGILLEFVDEPPIPLSVETGKEPTAEEITPDKPIELVQKAEAPTESKISKAAESRRIGDKGDIEKFEPQKEEIINEKSLFSSADNRKKGEGEQTSSKASESLKAGHPQGNTTVGTLSGEPIANLEGRDALGKLPKPEYNRNIAGTIVIDIVVDSQGVVTSAKFRAKGSKIPAEAADLIKAAQSAALKSRFAPRPQNPDPQAGTITYIFKLK